VSPFLISVNANGKTLLPAPTLPSRLTAVHIDVPFSHGDTKGALGSLVMISSSTFSPSAAALDTSTIVVSVSSDHTVLTTGKRSEMQTFFSRNQFCRTPRNAELSSALRIIMQLSSASQGINAELSSVLRNAELSSQESIIKPKTSLSTLISLSARVTLFNTRPPQLPPPTLRNHLQN